MRSHCSYKDLNQHQLPTQFVEKHDQAECTKNCSLVVGSLPLYHLCAQRKAFKGDLKVKTALDLRPQIWL